MCVISSTQHCVTLSTTEAEFVAEGIKTGLLIRPAPSFMRPRVAFLTALFEHNE